MLELFGSGYVIDHCVSAFLEYKKDELYRVYVTDSLKHLARLDTRYADIIKDFGKPKETRTAEDIISGIRSKITELGGDS